MECKSVEITVHDDRDMTGRGSRDTQYSAAEGYQDEMTPRTCRFWRKEARLPLLVSPFAKLWLPVYLYTVMGTLLW
jgi:hypothetical protein